MSLARALSLLLAAAPLTNEDLPNLVHAVGYGSRPEVDRAINGLQYLGTPKPAMRQLVKMAKGEAPGNRESAAYALAVLAPPEAGPLFGELLVDDDGALRLAGCQGLGRLKPQKALLPRVGEALGDKVSPVRRECARTLANWAQKGSDKPLLAALKAEQDPDARLMEIDALGKTGGPAAPAALEPLLQSGSEEVRYAAARALARLGAPAGRKALEGWAAAKDPSERRSAVEILGQLDAPWAADALAGRLADPDVTVAVKAGKALAARKDPRGVKSLVLRTEKSFGEDRMALETALLELKVTQRERLDIIGAAGQAK